MLSFVGRGKTLFTFEDLTRVTFPPPTLASDEDFTDLAFSIDVELVPEPSSLVLLLLAMMALLAGARHRRMA